MMDTDEPTAVTRWNWLGKTIWLDQYSAQYDISPALESEDFMFLVTKHAASIPRYSIKLWMNSRTGRLMYGKQGKWFAEDATVNVIRWVPTVRDKKAFEWQRLENKEDCRPHWRSLTRDGIRYWQHTNGESFPDDSSDWERLIMPAHYPGGGLVYWRNWDQQIFFWEHTGESIWDVYGTVGNVGRTG